MEIGLAELKVQNDMCGLGEGFMEWDICGHVFPQGVLLSKYIH